MATSETNQLTPGEIFRIKEVFMQFDDDGDGAIASKLLEPALRLLNIHITDAEVGNLLDEADIERKGPVDYPEFIRVVAMKRKNPSQENEEENF